MSFTSWTASRSALVAVYDELQATGTLRTGRAELAVIKPKDPLDDLSF